MTDVSTDRHRTKQTERGTETESQAVKEI